MTLKNQVSAFLENALSLKNITIEVPKDKSFGDFSTPVAFSLAKEYKKSPMLIAKDLCEKMQESDFFQEVGVLNGFINFRINHNTLNKYINDILENGFIPKEKTKDKILLEFVSANPTGPLHIGHARGAIIGEALSSIGKFVGYDIDTEYYVNDAGNQIALLGISLQIAYKEQISKIAVDTYPAEYYKGSHIDSTVLDIFNNLGKDIFKEENFKDLCLIAKDKMLCLIKDDLKSLDIKFDYFINESTMYDKLDSILNALKQNNAVYEKDEKLWLNSTKMGDEKDRVIIKEDKSPTYLAGDIIYHNEKFKRNYDKYINIWGADHHGYIARVKASIDYLGFDSNKLEIILSQMVALLQNGKPYKMSKRKGTFIYLKEVVDIVGKDALKLTFLSKKCDTHLEFDIQTLTNQDSSNPIFYIQYAHTRIFSLLQKTSFTKDEISNHEITHKLDKDARWLIVSSLMLPDVLENAFSQREINKFIDYLYLLASSLHSFYNQNKIIGSNEELDHLKILSLVAISIKTSLSLIGIQAKEKM